MHPDDGDDLDELLRCADAAAEAAELGGGGLFGFYSQPLNVRAQRRARIERALVGALDRGEFHLHYQPQLDTRDGTLVAAEALLRFESIALGPVGPDEFIPVLEANGGIEQVGAWVIESACAQGAAWMRADRPVRIGVNVSARQLGAPGFEQTISEALERSKLDPRLLELELTESVLVENAVETRKLIEAIRARGISVALDDFGTGYASLAYIRQFPMNKLKIDRQFVRGLPVDAEAVAITSAIIALARSLRLDIVAEGVEHEAEEEFLHTQHCFVVQGYLHARPMARDAFDTWRQKRPWA
jgi:EAL domain-containing protein (putative c-di-GMP-specific phosphodiesterase class I)